MEIWCNTANAQITNHAGAYLVICGFALYSIMSACFLDCWLLLTSCIDVPSRNRPQKSRQTWILFSTLFFTFAITTFCLATEIAYLAIPLESILINNSDEPFKFQVDAYNSSRWLFPLAVVGNIISTGGAMGLMVGVYYIINSYWAPSQLWF